ncbi:hypothetical protein GMMP15_660080 [Candidatus Magnetomoraceae bacterium gMMP-15]
MNGYYMIKKTNFYNYENQLTGIFDDGLGFIENFENCV